MSLLIIISFVVFVFFLLFFVFLLGYYHWRWPSTRKMYRGLPSPSMSSVFGIGLDLLKLNQTEILDYIKNMSKKYGPIVYFEIMGAPEVFLNKPEYIELVLNNSQHITKGLEYHLLLPVLREGLATSTGSKWHTRRNMLTPTFHFKVLENFVPIFNRNAKLLTKNLMANSENPVDVNFYTSLCTLDIICETAMGTYLGLQLAEVSEYVTAVKNVLQICTMRSLKFWMMNDLIFNMSPTGRKLNRNVKFLHNFTEKVIKERKEKYNPDYMHREETKIGKPKQRKSFLDCLIQIQRENPTQMTDEGIQEEVNTFMSATLTDYGILGTIQAAEVSHEIAYNDACIGYDSTSMSLTWTLFMIAVHDEVQEKLREEIEHVFGDSDRDATMQDLQQLTYLEMTIKESLRLYPSVPYISRLLTTNLKIKDHVIPPGTNIIMLPYLVHRNPDEYPEPEKYIPERFLPHVVKERHPYSYIPFSAGYRNCIGQRFALYEEKVVISTILRKFHLSTTMKKDEVKVIIETVLLPTPKIKITFTPLQAQ